MDGLTDQKTDSFIEMLSGLGHESPMEHMNFTFGIENVSRSLLAQITRHRHASFSVQSQRYVKELDFEFITPPQIADNPEAKKIYLTTMQDIANSYNTLADMLNDYAQMRGEETK